MPALSKKEGNELISTQTPQQMVTGMERETESHVQHHTYYFFLEKIKKKTTMESDDISKNWKGKSNAILQFLNYNW